MSYHEKTTFHHQRAIKNERHEPADVSEPSVKGGAETALQRAKRLIAAGEYEKANDCLLAAGKSPPVQDARGVCLLRLGRFEAAIRLYRELVLHAGSTWMRPGLPTSYKANYATALLLGGHPSGCLEILHEIGDEEHPPVRRLRAAVARWQSTLPLWQRLNWWLARIEPSSCIVPIDFTPGEIDEPGMSG